MKQKSSYDIKNNLMLALLSGIILGFSFPPFQFGIIAIIGFVPVFILFESIDTYKKAFRYSYFAFFVFNLVACYWIGGWGSEVDIFLMISGIAVTFFHPLFFTIPFLLFFAVKKNLGKNYAFLSFPFIWVAFEYFHSITEFSFPWLIIGNSQSYSIYDIQYISYTGVYGISFWIISLNILIYLVYSKFINSEPSFTTLKAILMIAAIVLFFYLPALVSRSILMDYESGKNKIKVAIIQPNINPWEKWKKSKEFEQVLDLLEMSKKIDKEQKPDLIIWPETAIPFYIRLSSRADEMATIRRIVDSSKLNIITGAADIKFYNNQEPVPASSKQSKQTGVAYDSYNSIIHFEPNTEKYQIYHKMKLVPFSERIPYLDAYPFLVDFLEWGVGISNWGIGKDSIIFRLPSKKLNAGGEVMETKIDSADRMQKDISFWAMICYESIFPGFVSEFAKKGAQFFIIVTNDSWFGNSSGPYQHNQFAVLRAIENRRSIARCANGGVSSIIDPTGRMVSKTKFMTKDILVGDVEINEKITFYSKHGDIFSQICLGISILFIISVLWVKFFDIRNKFLRYKNEQNN